MLYLKYISALILLASVLQLNAQKKENKKSDVQIIDFGDADPSEDVGRYTTTIIKTNPTSYLFGYQSVELEKTILDYLSVTGGLGLTFTPVLSNSFYAEFQEILEEPEYCVSDQWQDDYCDDYTDFTRRNQKIGLVFSTGLKLYFDSDAPDGSYFEFSARYFNKKYEAQKVEPSSNIIYNPNEFQYEKVSSLDLVGRYGYQYLHEKLTTESFIGLGVRKSNETRQDIGRNGSFYQNGEIKFKNTSLRVEIGVRIGLQM